MSEDKIYLNLTPKDTSKDSTTGTNMSEKMSSEDQAKGNATQPDEVTYSDVTFIKTGHSHQKQTDSDGDGVTAIYSQVNRPKKVPGNELDPSSPSDSSKISIPAKPDPANSSPQQHSEKESRSGISQRCTVLLLSLCVLLLAIAVTMVALYAVNMDTYSDITQKLGMLQEEYDNATAMTRTLEANLTGVKEQLDLLRVEHANVTLLTMLLQEEYDNATAMTRTLEANLTDVEHEFETLKAGYDNITTEKEACEFELSGMEQQYDNCTTDKTDVESKLSETIRMLIEQKNRNDDLTKETTKLKTELQGVRKCADDWEFFNGACYHFSTDKKTWTESRDACVTMGGHLVIINSQQEWEFLKTKGDHWIGLTDVQEEGQWRWVDNTPLTDPTFWADGQPDNSYEHFVRIALQKWNDAENDRVYTRICESRSCRT